MVRDRSSDVSAAYRKLMRMDTPGENLIGVWVWEYVLKYTSDVSLVRELTESLAFPKNAPRLKQMILIKQLSFQVSKDFDIKKTLDILEALHHAFAIENMDKVEVEREDVPLSKRFKASCCEAPTGLVKVRGLHEKTASKLRYNAGEESVWKGLQLPLLELKEELLKLTKRSASEQADAQVAKVKAIEGKLSALIKNAWALFGPVFLEKTEAAVINGKYKPNGVSFSLPLASHQKNVGTVDAVGDQTRNEGVSESAKRVLDDCYVETQTAVSGMNNDLEKKRQALTDSRLELEKVVKDPLPALLRMKNCIAGVPEPVQDQTRLPADAATRRSLLEPHSSAQAQVWDEDDEIEESPSRRSPSASRRLHLPPIHSPQRPTPKPMPAESSFATGTKHRRLKKKWSEEEVQTLMKEVHKYGKGRWKMILQRNKDVFNGRTEVDIKDKWRNLEKYKYI